MLLPPNLTDRCLDVLDKLIRSIEHELDRLRGELATHRGAASRLLARREEVRQLISSTLLGIAALQASSEGIDVAAVERQRGWMLRLEQASLELGKEQERLDRLIATSLAQLDSLQRRLRVLQRARQRRSQRLVLGRQRRSQRDADEMHLLGALSGAGA
jgi:chromosome segregation ATPase